jgi:Zn-finger protein
MELESIAKVAREEMELFAKDNPSIGDPITLYCYCAISSLFLQRLARKYGYNISFAQGEAFRGSEHCWVVHNEKIYDITVTQFESNYPTVYVTNITNSKYKVERFNKDARKYIKDGWPEEQNPLTHFFTLTRHWKSAKEKLDKLEKA